MGIRKNVIIFLLFTTLALANNNQKLDPVIVVANKVEENLQNVPQSITVIDGSELEEKGIKTIEGIIGEIPNMTSTPDRGVKVNFRGLNASLFTENNPVVIYVDGIPISSKRSYLVSLENIERVEVLRGPQGTLYGKDAIGGVINIITKEPSNDINGSIGFEYGSNNYRRNTFNLNAPLILNKFFINLNSDITFDDGWVTNRYNNDDKAAKESRKNFGASLYYKVTDKFSAKLVLKKDKNKKYGFKGYGIATKNPFSLNPIYAKFNDFKRSKAENHSFEMTSYEKYVIDSQALSFKYDTDEYSFNSTTVHRKTKVNGKYDLDYTNGTYLDGSYMFNDENLENYSQEFRLSNKNKDGIRWITGIYLDTTEQKHDPYGTHTVVYGIDSGKNNMKSELNSDTKAIFAQTMIPISEKFDLTLGARYQKIKKEINYDYYSSDVKTSEYDTEKTWNTFIPKIGLKYEINENLSSFTSISKGYMPGGFNSAATSTNSKENTFEPQKSTNYEIGIKGAYSDFNFTASIFKMNIEDIHVYRRLVSGDVSTDNADKAHSQGVELDFNYYLNDNFRINTALGYIKTEYDSYSVGDYDFSGNKIETTPSHTANLSIIYNHSNGFYARTDIKNQGSMYFYDDINKRFVKENGHTLVDVKIGYRLSDWDIYFYGKNLTDEKYVNMYESNNYFSYASFGDSRFLGIGLKYSF